MSISEINEKKREVLRVIEELQRLYEEAHGKCCQMDIDLHYHTIKTMGGLPEHVLTGVSVSCDITL